MMRCERPPLTRSLIAATLALQTVGVMAPKTPGATEPVALELVLAVDCSSSVSTGEFHLQMEGIAQAFLHPDIVAAIEATAPEGIAVSLLLWSSEANQVQSVGWTHLTDAATAAALAEQIRGTPRVVGGGSTAIGAAIMHGLDLIRRNGFSGERKAIDVSGDGAANQGPEPERAREVAAALSVSVNGLAILNEDPALALYYEREVIGGPGAFMVTARNYRDFAKAILKKLLLEIGGTPVAQRRQDERSAPRLSKVSNTR